MAATITWTVTEMTCYPEAEGQPDVVFGVYWVCKGVQDTYSTQVAAPSACNIPLPTASFIPYADLTQEQVLNWIWANGVKILTFRQNDNIREIYQGIDRKKLGKPSGGGTRKRHHSYPLKHTFKNRRA